MRCSPCVHSARTSGSFSNSLDNSPLQDTWSFRQFMSLFWSSSVFLGSFSPCLSMEIRKKPVRALKHAVYSVHHLEKVRRVLPVTMVRAAMQEKADTSKLMLWRLEENSTIESIHSPKPRTHCNLCKTIPLQKMSLSSARLDLVGKLKSYYIMSFKKKDVDSSKFQGYFAYLYASRSTKSSRKADSKRSSWSHLGSSVKPGIFSAHPRMMLIEAVSRS